MSYYSHFHTVLPYIHVHVAPLCMYIHVGLIIISVKHYYTLYQWNLRSCNGNTVEPLNVDILGPPTKCTVQFRESLGFTVHMHIHKYMYLRPHLVHLQFCEIHSHGLHKVIGQFHISQSLLLFPFFLLLLNGVHVIDEDGTKKKEESEEPSK